MATKQPFRYHMVVALDLSEYADVVLEHALDLAARHEACDLQVITVHEHGRELDDEQTRLVALVRSKLPVFRARDRDWKVRMHVRVGDTAEQIVALAGESLADVIVLGRFGRHRTFWRHGSVTDRVLAQAPCSTLVVQLTDIAVETQRQCPACVEVRSASDGEQWFCAAHHTDRPPAISFPVDVKHTDSGVTW